MRCSPFRKPPPRPLCSETAPARSPESPEQVEPVAPPARKHEAARIIKPAPVREEPKAPEPRRQEELKPAEPLCVSSRLRPAVKPVVAAGHKPPPLSPRLWRPKRPACPAESPKLPKKRKKKARGRKRGKKRRRKKVKKRGTGQDHQASRNHGGRSRRRNRTSPNWPPASWPEAPKLSNLL